MAQRNGVEFAVSRSRDKACRPVLLTLREMDHEMLPVPHGGDHGHLRADAVVCVGRLHHEPVRALHERQIARDQKAQGFLHESRARDAFDEPTGERSGLLGIEQAMQVDDEIAHLRVVHGRLRPAFQAA